MLVDGLNSGRLGHGFHGQIFCNRRFESWPWQDLNFQKIR